MDVSEQGPEQAPKAAQAFTLPAENPAGPRFAAETAQPPGDATNGGAGDAVAGTPSPAPAPVAEDDEDPLIRAQREQEENEKALAEASNIQPYDDADMREFYSDMREVDRENEVNRILGAFKLNPFEMLGLRFTASDEDIKRAYRKVSLAVHPDKCTHPRAKDAFETIGHAQKELLHEEKRKSLDFLLNAAKDEVVKEWKKAAKGDAAARLAAVLDESGKEGVQASWEKTEEFHEAWKIKARDVLAKAEWRRRKMTKRMKEEEERAKEEHQKGKEDSKKKREADKEWEHGREERVGSWRNFVTGKTKKSKKSSSSGGGGSKPAIGGLKPPKAKTEDPDKSYVQRPVGEQFRPPPPKR